jgi:hypothetical protein
MTDDYRNTEENIKVVGDVIATLIELRNATDKPEVQDEITILLDTIFDLSK